MKNTFNKLAEILQQMCLLVIIVLTHYIIYNLYNKIKYDMSI